MIVTGVNRHDVSQLARVLDVVGLAKPEHITLHLNADKGYDGEPAQMEIAKRGYVPRAY